MKTPNFNKLIIVFLIIIACVFAYQILFPKVIIENIPKQTPEVIEVIPQVIPQDYKG